MNTQQEYEALLKQAKELLNENRFHDVINLLTDKVLVQQLSAELYNARARAHEALNQFKEQLKYLEYSKNTEIDAKNIFAYNNLIIRKPDGDTREPEELVREMLKRNPNSSDCNLVVGGALENLGFKEEAEECYRRAIEINPNNSNYYYHLGFLLQQNRNLVEAEHCYQKAIVINSSDSYSYYRLGVILQYKGDIMKAEECFRKVVEIDPNDYTAYEHLGGIFFNNGNEKKAFEYFTTATFYNNKLATSYLNLSSIDIEINPNASRHFNRAMYLFFKQKHYEYLILCIKKALEFDMPMMVYRIMELLPLEEWKRFESFSIDIQKNLNQTKFFRWLIEIWRTQTKNPEKSLLSEAIINFYLGDTANAYNIFNEELYSEEVGLNLFGQYYFCLSAIEIMEEEDTILNAAMQQADITLSGNKRISLIERYYGGLIFYLCGNYSKAISILNSLFPDFRPAGYKLIEIYDALLKSTGKGSKEAKDELNTNYLTEKEKVIEAIRLEESFNPLYQFGIEIIEPTLDEEKFLEDIMPAIHFMEIQQVIGQIFLKPFELRHVFANCLKLTENDSKKENLSLKEKAAKVWLEFIEAEVNSEELKDLFKGFSNFSHPLLRLGEFIQNAANKELFDVKEKHIKPSHFNFKLYLTLNFKLYKSGFITLKDACNINDYTYTCMDVLSSFEHNDAKQYLLNCIKDYFLEGTILWYFDKLLPLLEKVRKEIQGKKSPILNFKEFLTLSELG